MSEPQFESPLSGPASRTDRAKLAVDISEVSDRGMIDLRGELSDRKFAAAAKKVLGIDLPVKPRTSTTHGDLSILWLSVDQWLVCCPRAKIQDVLGELREALTDIHSLAVDLSDARAIIRLQGNGAREILMKGAPVNLLSTEIVAGTVRRLRYGEIAAMVHIVDERPDTIDLYIFRSYAEFAWDWLVETGRRAAAIRLFGQQDPPVV